MTHLLAQIRNPVLPPILGGGNNPNPNSGGQAIGKLISNLVSALFIAGFLLAFMQLLLGGVTWITSGGDKQKLEKARDQITNSIVGIIIVASAFALSSLVARFFGLDLTALTIPSITK
jgi:uncharacterized membrane protein YciS (DUF1049 family)